MRAEEGAWFATAATARRICRSGLARDRLPSKWLTTSRASLLQETANDGRGQARSYKLPGCICLVGPRASRPTRPLTGT